VKVVLRPVVVPIDNFPRVRRERHSPSGGEGERHSPPHFLDRLRQLRPVSIVNRRGELSLELDARQLQRLDDLSLGPVAAVTVFGPRPLARQVFHAFLDSRVCIN
jgi:hypothetical protein